jgi:small subunit ribosomal protein S17
MADETEEQMPADADSPAEPEAAEEAASAEGGDEAPKADGGTQEAAGEPAEAAEAGEQPAAAEVAEQAETATGAGDAEAAPEGGDEPEAVVPAAAGEPAEKLSPKERRRRERSRHSGEARPQRSAEERHAERLATRRVKADRRRARRIQERAKRAARTREAAGGERAPGGAEAAALAPVHAETEGKRKVRQGVVISNRAEKTIVVRIDIARRHRRYEKIVRSSNTLHAHDENNDAREGDVVRVIESRPLSRTKRWRLVEVLERAQ